MHYHDRRPGRARLAGRMRHEHRDRHAIARREPAIFTLAHVVRLDPRPRRCDRDQQARVAIVDVVVGRLPVRRSGDEHLGHADAAPTFDAIDGLRQRGVHCLLGCSHHGVEPHRAQHVGLVVHADQTPHVVVVHHRAAEVVTVEGEHRFRRELSRPAIDDMECRRAVPTLRERQQLAVEPHPVRIGVPVPEVVRVLPLVPSGTGSRLCIDAQPTSIPCGHDHRAALGIHDPAGHSLRHAFAQVLRRAGYRVEARKPGIDDIAVVGDRLTLHQHVVRAVPGHAVQPPHPGQRRVAAERSAHIGEAHEGIHEAAELGSVAIDGPQARRERSAEDGLPLGRIEHETLVVHPLVIRHVGIVDSRDDPGRVELFDVEDRELGVSRRGGHRYRQVTTAGRKHGLCHHRRPEEGLERNESGRRVAGRLRSRRAGGEGQDPARENSDRAQRPRPAARKPWRGRLWHRSKDSAPLPCGPQGAAQHARIAP